MDKATLSSYVMLIVIPVCTYFGFSEATKSALCGVIVALLLLAGQIYNEKHNSKVLSVETNDTENEEEEEIEEADC